MTAADDVAELRAATREAHETIKDLRAVIKEARGVVEEVKQVAYQEVDARLSAAVTEGLAEYRGAVMKAIDDASKTVFDRFDTVAEILLGETKRDRRLGRPGLPDVARQIKEGRG